MSRYLTVLMTDIEGFTARAQTIPRDGVLSLLDSYRQAVRPAAESHAGRIVKELGDGFLIVFDSPTEALLAARDIRAAVQRQENLLGPLPVRIAATAGDINEVNGDIFGDAVNLVARLEGETPANRIWASGAIVAGVKKSEVELLPLGLRTFRGFDEPIPIAEAFPLEAGQYAISSKGRHDGPFTHEEVMKRAAVKGVELLVRDAARDQLVPFAQHPHFAAAGTNPVSEESGLRALTRFLPVGKRGRLAIVFLAVIMLVSAVAYWYWAYANSKSTAPARQSASAANGQAGELGGLKFLGTWYLYVISNVEIVDQPKRKFLQEVNGRIGGALGYCRDERNTITGIIIAMDAAKLNMLIEQGGRLVGSQERPRPNVMSAVPPEGYPLYVVEEGSDRSRLRIRGQLLALKKCENDRVVETLWSLPGQ